MFKRLAIAAAVAAVTAGAAGAATIEVKMLNKGEGGTMIFEPAFVQAEPGDVVVFLPTDKGHNVESIKGMLPEGVEPFKSAYNEEYALTVGEEGLYGVKCTPHYGMGMVALIQSGAAVNLEDAEGVKQKGKAKKRFQELFAQVQ